MPIRIRRTFDRKSIRRGVSGAVSLWRRVEQRWDENPGYVAATTAGTIGILLALSLMVNAGIDWFNGPPDEPPAVAQADADDDLGDSDDEVMRGLRRVDPDEDDESPIPPLSRREEPDDQDDPFERPVKFDRAKAIDVADDAMGDEPAADEPTTDDTDDFQRPARITPPARTFPSSRVASIEKPPKRQVVIEEDEDEEDVLPERSAPKIDLGQEDEKSDDEEIAKDNATELAETVRDQLAAQKILDKVLAEDDADGEPETLPESAPTEPAFLKTNGERDADFDQPEQARRIEPDDDVVPREAHPARPPAREPTREIQRPETDQPAAREHSRWQQQRPRAEQPPVEARRSRNAETVVVAPRETPVARRTAPQPRETSASQKSSADEPLKLSITGPANVGLGEACSYVLSLANTGTTTTRELVVSIELPPGLVHEVSQSLEQNVASIPPGGSHRSLLKLRAARPGQSTIQAEIVDGNRVAAKLTARVQVGSTTAARVVMSDCCCEELR